MRTTKLGWVLGGCLLSSGAALFIACSDDEKPATADAGAGDSSAADTGQASDAGADTAAACATLPGSYGGASCNKCMQTSCCAVITACENDPDCKQMQACTFACAKNTDAGGCYKECLMTNKAAQPLWNPVNDCWYSDPPGCGVSCTN